MDNNILDLNHFYFCIVRRFLVGKVYEISVNYPERCFGILSSRNFAIVRDTEGLALQSRKVVDLVVVSFLSMVWTTKTYGRSAGKSLSGPVLGFA